MAERYSEGEVSVCAARRVDDTRGFRNRRPGSSWSWDRVCGRRTLRGVSFATRDETNGTRTDELVVLDDARVELNFQSFRMVGRAGADLVVARVLRVLLSTRVPHRGLEDALVLLDGVVLEEDVLDAPEAAGGEGGDFRCGSGHGCDSLACWEVLELVDGGGRESERNEVLQTGEHMSAVGE